MNRAGTITNIPALKIRTSPILEHHPDNLFIKLKTKKDARKTAQYFNISTTANPAKTQISMTIFKFLRDVK